MLPSLVALANALDVLEQRVHVLLECIFIVLGLFLLLNACRADRFLLDQRSRLLKLFFLLMLLPGALKAFYLTGQITEVKILSLFGFVRRLGLVQVIRS